MRSLTMRRHTYDWTGRSCVFCLKNYPSSEMTDEHVVPEAIHGSLVIKNGSCIRCARHSNAFYENSTINNEFKVPRFLLNLRGKGRGKPIKDIRHLPPVFAGDQLKGGDETALNARRLAFSPELYPKWFALPVFSPPGFVSEIDRGGSLSEIQFQIFNVGGSSVGGLLTSQMKMNTGGFPRTIAKIAYCYAVAEKGFSAFDGQGVRDFLEGKRDDAFNFVGNSATTEYLSNRDLHGLYFRRRGEWLTVLVHLFASLASEPRQTRPYEVVVGKAL